MSSEPRKLASPTDLAVLFTEMLTAIGEGRLFVRATTPGLGSTTEIGEASVLLHVDPDVDLDDAVAALVAALRRAAAFPSRAEKRRAAREAQLAREEAHERMIAGLRAGDRVWVENYGVPGRWLGEVASELPVCTDDGGRALAVYCVGRHRRLGPFAIRTAILGPVVRSD